MSSERSKSEPAFDLRTEHLQHAASAGTKIEQRAERLVGKRRADRLLHRFVGDMEFANAVPLGGVSTEISLRCCSTRLPHRGQPFAVTRDGLVARIEAFDKRARHVRASTVFGKPEEGPRPFPKALHQPCFDQELEVP